MCAQKTERVVKCAIIKLLGNKLLMGSTHKKFKALTNAINDARAKLIAVGQEPWIFSSRTTIGILVSKIKKETQS